MSIDEYVRLYLRDDDANIVIQNFIKEFHDTIDKRGVTTDRGVRKVLDSLNKKWEAIAKRTNNLMGVHPIRPDGFTWFIKTYFQEVYTKWKKQ